MQTFTITDPHDRENPVVEPSAPDSLIYHGTHSMFSPRIEEQGFCFDGFKAAYGAEIRNIIVACDELNFIPDGYSCAKGFSEKNGVYFSVYFRSARGYALNVGGERLYGAIRAADAFLAFTSDRDLVGRKAAHLAAVLHHYGRHALTERVLSNLRNNDLIRRLSREVENTHSVLKNAIKDGYPVVYAVRANQKWLRKLGANAIGDWNREPFGGIRLGAVSADRIVARIEYPNGISPDSE